MDKLGVFIVGLLIGILATWLAGVGSRSEGIPDIAGVSGEGLAWIYGNSAVTKADFRVTLFGSIDSIEGNTIHIVHSDSAWVPVIVSGETSIIETLQDGGVQSKNLQLKDLAKGDVVTVFGKVEGGGVIAETIIREIND